jgi:hypothetical protein
MSIRTLIDGGLRYLTKRRNNMVKNVSRKRTKVGSATAVCGACGGELVETNINTHNKACFKCGKKAQ